MYTEVPNYRDAICGVRGNEFKLIDEGDNKIATEVSGNVEKQVGIEEIPPTKRSQLEAELDREFDSTEVATAVDRREFREDLAALGYLDE